ncbi:hypothetical protein LG047_08855 [Methylocystis sp. WRRC1]|uniref:NepR family anti-sigma factor n=1 Tax=Methylocystis sp. WRRC1 TaxID=1732014 RepID=UPI001D13D9A1|nr:NepR family anti-sigma factor [Methylocystis sp. WRRC1]MCC3245431.1 hypothetical protein [Methylocystis sp. WRRC1]
MRESPNNSPSESGRAAASGRGTSMPAGKTNSRLKYDDLAGSSMLRRSGKAAANQPSRGDPGTTLLSARRRGGVEQILGKQLRDLYRSVLAEPVPARFVELLNNLEARRNH